MKNKATQIAYLCSNCDDYKKIDINIFDFSGIRQKTYTCECEMSKLTVTKNGAKSFKVDLYCPVCKENHSYMIPYNQFFSDNVFSFSCPYYEANILFVGSGDKLDKQIDEYIGNETTKDEETHIFYDNETIEKMIALTGLVYEHPEKIDICNCKSTFSVAYNEKGIYIICDSCHYAKNVTFDKMNMVLEDILKGDIKNV